MKLSLAIGALSPRISEQVESQGLTLDSQEAAPLQRLHESIVLLHVQGILSDAEKNKASKRLLKKVMRHVT